MERRRNSNQSVIINEQKKKPPPQIKQTLTSKLRMLKANPLLRYELENKIAVNCPESGGGIAIRPLTTLLRVLDDENSIGNSIKTSFVSHETSVSVDRKYKTSKRDHFHQEKYLDKKVHPMRQLKISQNKNAVGVITNTPQISKKVKHHTFTENSKRHVYQSCEITRRLSEWLRKRGKSLGDYQHLKCFGVVCSTKFEQENKENTVINVIGENSCNKLKEEKNGNRALDGNLFDIAQDALVDLHKLIWENYPSEHCEMWLKLIKDSCKQVEEESQYWECRAALEQTRGNLNLAVECYKTAIVQGAEVKNVDKYLDQLLQKFSLLNIKEASVSNGSNKRSKIVEDARNIFKSSIIQFAVQERAFKKKDALGLSLEKKLIVTPVRRSTRLSRSTFTSTPSISIYSSLNEVDKSIKNVLEFKCNNALRG